MVMWSEGTSPVVSDGETVLVGDREDVAGGSLLDEASGTEDSDDMILVETEGLLLLASSLFVGVAVLKEQLQRNLSKPNPLYSGTLSKLFSSPALYICCTYRTSLENSLDQTFFFGPEGVRFREVPLYYVCSYCTYTFV